MKSRTLEKVAAVSCALILTVGVLRSTVMARAQEASEDAVTPEPTFVVVDLSGISFSGEETEPAPETSTPYIEVTDNRSSVPLSVDGEIVSECTVIGGVPCVGAVEFCRALGMEVTGQVSGGSFSLTGDIDLQARDGDIYFVCCGRYLYVENGVTIRDGQAMLPVEELAKCLNVSAAWDRVRWEVVVSSAGLVPLENGRTYYDETDVYWLSHVIYAEAGSQSLKGQIAVGNVVLNRVASEEFLGQDDVYSVIFAKNQFEVVINGMIYMQPDDTAVIAAKLALEGYDVTNGSTYFATFFFGEGYECVMWIEDHCFMTEA